MKRGMGTTLLAGGVILGALQFAAPWVQGAELTQQLKPIKNYKVLTAPVEQLHLDTPELPDMSGYTAEAVEAKIDRGTRGRVVVRRMLQQDALKDFIGGNDRLREWVRRQHGMPQAIFVEGGHVTPQDLARALPDSQFSETEPGVYLAGTGGVRLEDGKTAPARVRRDGQAEPRRSGSNGDNHLPRGLVRPKRPAAPKHAAADSRDVESDGARYRLLPPRAAGQLDEDFLELIRALEQEFDRHLPRVKHAGRGGRAILVHVTTGPRDRADSSIAELGELATTATKVGSTLVVDVQGDEAIRVVLERALSANARIESVIPKRETLEDIFVRKAL